MSIRSRAYSGIVSGSLEQNENKRAELEGACRAVARDTSPRTIAFRSGLLLGAAYALASPASAQQAAEPAPLPPLNVETTAKKKSTPKKSAAKKKSAPAGVSPAPQASPASG